MKKQLSHAEKAKIDRRKTRKTRIHDKRYLINARTPDESQVQEKIK